MGAVVIDTSWLKCDECEHLEHSPVFWRAPASAGGVRAKRGIVNVGLEGESRQAVA
jgi:hypothetical protein